MKQNFQSYFQSLDWFTNCNTSGERVASILSILDYAEAILSLFSPATISMLCVVMQCCYWRRSSKFMWGFKPKSGKPNPPCAGVSDERTQLARKGLLIWPVDNNVVEFPVFASRYCTVMRFKQFIQLSPEYQLNYTPWQCWSGFKYLGKLPRRYSYCPNIYKVIIFLTTMEV